MEARKKYLIFLVRAIKFYYDEFWRYLNKNRHFLNFLINMNYYSIN